MMFFKRILKQPESAPVAAPAQPERRGENRYTISPDFPLKAVLGFVGRDESGAPMSNTRHGWNWKGVLLDCSEQGARMQLGPGVKAENGETCDLILTVQDFEITVPCEVINLTEVPGGSVFGLQHKIEDPETLQGYRQLLEVVALGSTLKLQTRPPLPDPSGYAVDQYISQRGSRLTVWRHPADGSVSAFEFQLKDNLVRAAVGRGLEFLADIDGTGSQPASSTKCLEIQRLFLWVVPNIAAAVPEDVRSFLKHYVT